MRTILQHYYTSSKRQRLILTVYKKLLYDHAHHVYNQSTFYVL